MQKKTMKKMGCIRFKVEHPFQLLTLELRYTNNVHKWTTYYFSITFLFLNILDAFRVYQFGSHIPWSLLCYCWAFKMGPFQGKCNRWDDSVAGSRHGGSEKEFLHCEWFSAKFSLVQTSKHLVWVYACSYGTTLTSLNVRYLNSATIILTQCCFTAKTKLKDIWIGDRIYDHKTKTKCIYKLPNK